MKIYFQPHWGLWWIGLVWFGFYFKSKPNQIKPHTFLSCGSDEY